MNKTYIYIFCCMFSTLSIAGGGQRPRKGPGTPHKSGKPPAQTGSPQARQPARPAQPNSPQAANTAPTAVDLAILFAMLALQNAEANHPNRRGSSS